MSEIAKLLLRVLCSIGLHHQRHPPHDKPGMERRNTASTIAGASGRYATRHVAIYEVTKITNRQDLNFDIGSLIVLLGNVGATYEWT